MTSYSTGQKIELNDGRVARIRFVGTTAFQTGEWIGVELDEPTGKNDGSVKGDRYFECEQGHGMFVRATGVRVVLEEAPKAQHTKLSNGAAASVKSRPSSMHAAVNGVKKTDLSARRTSTIAASPTPGARHTRMSSIRSPTKSPTKQLGSNGISSTSTSRTATPPVAATRKPTTTSTASRPRPSIVSSTSTTARTPASTVARTRTSLAPSTNQLTFATQSAVAQRAAVVSKTVQKDKVDRHADIDKDGHTETQGPRKSEDGASHSEMEDVTPLTFAPPPPPVPPDIVSKGTSGRRASSPSASIHSQRTIRGAAISSRHVEDLEAKISFLERKRLEDRDVKRSLEQAQFDRDKYQGIIERLQRKYQPQQQEITELKKALAEAGSKNATVEDLQAEHDAIMEMATLDKEMAEETAEALKIELDALRSRQEEMELELEVLREENAEFSKDMSPEERNSAGWLQLEKENERLRNALLRLRDLTQDREAELKSDLEELRIQVKDYEKISSQLEETKEKLLVSESNADDLRQQLEAALGAEDMIEELTDRNMGLTERIDELKTTIEDLENLKELNDELEVNHIEAEKQLQEEIDFKDALVLDRERVLKQQQAALDDTEYTINRFRELVTQLQSDLQDMQASKQISETEAADLESKSRAMMDLNARLQTSAAKTQVKTIDLELRKMEAEEASEHLAIIQLFLPETFHAERDSVLALLRFKRISFKSSLLQNFFRDRIASFGVRGHDEDCFAGVEVHNCLTWISGLANRFIKTIWMSTLEDFARYESVQYELEPVERALNNYIDAVRREDIDEMVMAEELQRSIAVIDHLASMHLNESLASHSDGLVAQLLFLQGQMEGIASAFAAIKVLVEEHIGHKDAEDDNEEASSGIRLLSARAENLASHARSIKVVLGKTYRAVQDLAERSMTLDPVCVDGLHTSETLARRITKYACAVGEQLRGLFDEEGRQEPLSVDEVSTTVMRVATRLLDLPAPEAGPYVAVAGQLRALSDSVAGMAILPNDLDNAIEFTRAPAPWVARAEQLRQHKATAQDTAAELARATEGLREREVTIRSKEAELEEQSVRIEMLEARMREAGKRSARIAELEKIVHDTKDSERRAKQELDKSKREAANELDRVRDELSRAAQRPRPGETVSNGDEMGPGAQVAMRRQQLQIITLEAAVRFLKDENTRLQLPALTAPAAVSQSLAWLHEPLLKPKSAQQQQAQALQEKGRVVFQDLLRITLMSGNLDLTTMPENKLAWRPVKQSSRWQLEARKEQWAHWQDQKMDLVDDVLTTRSRSRRVVK